MSLRGAQFSDAKEISILSSQFGWNASEDEIKSRLEIILSRPDHKIFVYEGAAGALLGWIHVGVDVIVSSGKYGEVLAFVVREGVRGSGIGGELLLHAEKWIKDHDYHPTSIVIRCNNERKRTHEFYIRNGYDITMIGLRKAIDRQAARSRPQRDIHHALSSSDVRTRIRRSCDAPSATRPDRASTGARLHPETRCPVFPRFALLRCRTQRLEIFAVLFSGVQPLPPRQSAV